MLNRLVKPFMKPKSAAYFSKFNDFSKFANAEAQDEDNEAAIAIGKFSLFPSLEGETNSPNRQKLEN